MTTVTQNVPDLPIAAFPQFQDPQCSTENHHEHNRPDGQIRPVRSEQVDKQAGRYHAQVNDHVIGGEDRTRLHMGLVALGFLQQVEAEPIRDQSENRDDDHRGEVRHHLDAHKSADDLDEADEGESDLKVTRERGDALFT